MNKFIFKIIIFFVVINVSNCTNNNIEKLINDLKIEFKSIENYVYTQLDDFKKEKDGGIIIIILTIIKYIFKFS